MATNPFQIDIAGPIDFGGVSQALTGLGQVRQQAQQQKAQQKRRQDALAAFDAAMQSGDPEQAARASVEFPELQKQLESGIGIKSDKTKNIMGSAYQAALLDPDNALSILGEAAGQIAEIGGTPVNIARDMKAIEANPESTLQAMEMGLAAMSKPRYDALKAIRGTGLKMGETEILEDGTQITATAEGPIVYSPDGRRLRGQEATDAIARAREFRIENQRRAAEGRRRGGLEAERELKPGVAAAEVSAKEAAKLSAEALPQITKIRSNISSIDKAIAALDKGAKTGAIESRLPSIKAASVELDNVQRQLGLDLVGMTTFGALSEGELALALSTALPTGLDEPELRKWLVDKKNATQKLAKELRKTAIFLGKPGNTVAMYLEKEGGIPKESENLSDDELLQKYLVQ